MTFDALIKRFLVPSLEDLPFLILGTAALVLATAHGFEHIGGLAPCALCLEQRGGYWAAIGFSMAAIVFSRLAATKDGPVPLAMNGAMILALGYTAYLAGYHTGIEQEWWLGPPNCTSIGNASLEEIMSQTSIALCDQIPWSLFGISMAGYNALVATALTLFSANAFVRHLRGTSA